MIKEEWLVSFISAKEDVRLQPIYRGNHGERKTVFNKHSEEAEKRRLVILNLGNCKATLT